MIPRVGVCLLAMLALLRPAAAEPLREVSMGLASTSFATAPARIAKELGLYEKHGLTVRFTVLENASAATAALISRSVNAALSGPGELVVSQARGQDVVVLANIYAGLSGSLVLAKGAADKTGVSPNAPIAERLHALDGLIIASPSATGAYTVALRGAAKATGANIRFTYMALSAMPAALESGAIQGFIAGAPFWASPVRKGTGLLWVSGPKGEMPPDSLPASSSNLQVMRDVAIANPAWAAGLAAVFADLSKAIAERPAEVKSAVARIYPDLDPGTLDLLFTTEAVAWMTRPPTPDGIARDIAFIRSIGTSIPQTDRLQPAAMIYP